MKAGDLCSMLLDGWHDGALYKTNYTLSGLSPDKRYTVPVAVESEGHRCFHTPGKLTFNMAPMGRVFGHGASSGSEMSEGVFDILVQDCIAGNLLNGLQIKEIIDRGDR